MEDVHDDEIRTKDFMHTILRDIPLRYQREIIGAIIRWCEWIVLGIYPLGKTFATCSTFWLVSDHDVWCGSRTAPLRP
jgi:hypothetical protein